MNLNEKSQHLRKLHFEYFKQNKSWLCTRSDVITHKVVYLSAARHQLQCKSKSKSKWNAIAVSRMVELFVYDKIIIFKFIQGFCWPNSAASLAYMHYAMQPHDCMGVYFFCFCWRIFKLIYANLIQKVV